MASNDVETALTRYKIIREGAAQTPRAAETKRKLRDIAKRATDILTAVVGDDASARAALNDGTDNRRFPFIAIDDGVRWALVRLAQPANAAADLAKPVQPLALKLARDVDCTKLNADHYELVGLPRRGAAAGAARSCRPRAAGGKQGRA